MAMIIFRIIFIKLDTPLVFVNKCGITAGSSAHGLYFLEEAGPHKEILLSRKQKSVNLEYRDKVVWRLHCNKCHYYF